MAIKGKKKPRGGARTGARAPRPVVVVPKRPFLARRSTRWGAAALVLLAVGVTLLIAWRNQQADDRLARQGTAIDAVNSRVTLAVQGVAQPGAGSQLSLLPNFAAQLDGYRQGAVKPAKVTKDNKGVPALLDAAIKAVGEIEVPDELRNTEHTVEVIDAKTLMLEGLRAFKVAVELALSSADLAPRERNPILRQAADQVQVATRLFAYGQQKITNIRVELGTFEASDFNPIPGS